MYESLQQYVREFTMMCTRVYNDMCESLQQYVRVLYDMYKDL